MAHLACAQRAEFDLTVRATANTGADELVREAKCSFSLGSAGTPRLGPPMLEDTHDQIMSLGFREDKRAEIRWIPTLFATTAGGI